MKAQSQERGKDQKLALADIAFCGPTFACSARRIPHPSSGFHQGARTLAARTRWLDRSTWQSLLRVTESKFEWLPFAFPAILAFSYALEAASRLGMRLDLKWNIVLVG